MQESDVRRLKTRYSSVDPSTANDHRLNDGLRLGIAAIITLGDLLRDDLDTSNYGIGWWASYPALDHKVRIFISDYLLAAARDITTNLLEAYAYRLEFDHALADFKEYVKRGIRKHTAIIPPPRGQYDDLSHFRVSAHLVGMLRAFGSALDCLGACIVGVAGLPTGIVKTSLHQAKESLGTRRNDSKRLGRLYDDLMQCEADAGPEGWINWLISMRNTVVHRARRVVTFSVNRGDNDQVDLALLLPRSPDLTEVEAWIHAGGQVASHFEVPADEFLASLAGCVHSYIDAAAKLLTTLWAERRADPSLITQSPRQWKEPAEIIKPVPSFSGFDITPVAGRVTGVGVSNELALRLHAAGLTDLGPSDVRPVPAVWS
jgi:hypothetical protein